MRRRAGCFLLSIVAASVLGARSSPAAERGLTAGPYLQNPTPTAITVQWETDQPGEGVVRYRAADEPRQAELYVAGALFEIVPIPAERKDRDKPKPRIGPKRPERSRYAEVPSGYRYLYRARLTDLRPGTAYVYAVDVDLVRGSATSGEREFRTWPERADRVRFIIYGDTRTYPENHRLLTRQFGGHDPDFIVHVGDMVDDGGKYLQWRPQFFEPLGDVLDRIPMLMVLGNHENGARNLLRLFDIPRGPLETTGPNAKDPRVNYSFDCGPVHVAVLDYTKVDPEDVRWLARDLGGATAPWKIAAYHVPTFNLNGHCSDALRTTFLPLFERYDVDVVVVGHSHQYERFFPLRRAADPSAPPITFVTSGAGGAPLHPIARPLNSLLAAAACEYEYCLFDADARTLSLRVHNGEGKVIDSLDLAKEGVTYDAAYLGQVRTIEDAILTQGLATAGMPAARTLPAKGETVALSLRVAFPGLSAPVSVTAHLAEESARHYTMMPQMAWPAPDERAEAEVKVQVRALGDVTWEERDAYVLWNDDYVKVRRRFLKPALRFSLTISAGGLERVREYGAIEYVGPAKPTRR